MVKKKKSQTERNDARWFQKMAKRIAIDIIDPENHRPRFVERHL